MKNALSLLCVVSGTLMACGADPAFHQVVRNEGSGAAEISGGKQNGEAEANASAPGGLVPIGTQGPTADTMGGSEGTQAAVSEKRVAVLGANAGGANSSGANAGTTEPGQLATAMRDGKQEQPVVAAAALTPPMMGSENVYHPQKPVVPEGKTLLQLQVKQLESNAWFKNCLSISLNGQTQKVGCNKDPESIGRWVYLVADKAPACNHVSVKIETYFNLGSECAERAAKGLSCNGPYKATPDQTRSPSVAADREFYKVYDDARIDNHDSLIKSNFDWVLLKNDMVAFAASGNTSWLRVFFEDLSKATLDKARLAPAKAESDGINFNDYVFDIKGEDVKVNVEGTSAGCL